MNRYCRTEDKDRDQRMVKYCRSEDNGFDQRGWLGTVVLKLKIAIRRGG